MSRCNANPCCGYDYPCKIPLPQDKSGLFHLNEKYYEELQAEAFYNEAYDLADSVSDIYGCDEAIRKRLTDLPLKAITNIERKTHDTYTG